MFRLDRIEAVIDPETGEYMDLSTLDQVLAEFGVAEQDFRTPPEQKAALEACRAGVLVLMLVAWADGTFQETEREVVADYIRETCRHLRGWEIDPILDWAGRQYPVVERIDKVLARIIERDREGTEINRLLDAAIRLAEADGVVVEKEALSVKGMRDAKRIALRELGYWDVAEFTADWEFRVPLPAFADALDISHDQRIVDKRATFVWTVGNPPRNRFRAGDVFHAKEPYRITLQISQVTEAASLTDVQQVTFSLYRRRDDASPELVGRSVLPAPDFEDILRGEGDRFVAEAMLAGSAATPGLQS
jgi:hypothetical protein